MANARILKFSTAGELEVIDPALDTIELYDVTTSKLTVNGQSVILANGTLSNTGLVASILNMQTMYNNTNISGQCEIALKHSKNLRFINSVDNTYLIFESSTGNLQISGDLIVGGTTTVVNSVITSYDELLISPAVSSSIALTIEPDNGVVPISPLMRVKKIFGGPDIFSIGSNGNTTINGLDVNTTLTIGGAIINADYSAAKNALYGHIANNSNTKHSGNEISITGYSNPAYINVQTIVTDIDQRFTTLNNGLVSLTGRVQTLENNASGIDAYTHTQSSPSVTWVINHNKATKNVNVVIYDSANLLVVPQSIDTTSINTAIITFENPQIGRAVLVFVL